MRRRSKKTSEKQQRMLRFIREFMADNGFPPTVRDIQFACEISSTSVVDYNLRLMQRDGLIRRRPEMARGIELLDEKGRAAGFLPQIPVMGYIAAGEPLPGPSNEGWEHEPPLGTAVHVVGEIDGLPLFAEEPLAEEPLAEEPLAQEPLV